MKLIIGTCFHYDLVIISPFLKSLEENFDGVVCLLTNKEIRYYPKNYQLWVEVYNSQQHNELMPVTLNNANNYRYFLYENVLNRNPHFTDILLTDVRDVFFQSNPFGQAETDKLIVCCEEKCIKDEPYNSFWINAVFGPSYLEGVGNERVFCSGTILGKMEVIKQLLSDINSAMAEFGPALDSGTNQMIIDQAVFIDWVLKNKTKVEFNTNETGAIFTMGHASRFCFNSNAKLINKEGKEYSTLHQYDRFPFLVPLLKSQISETVYPKNSIHHIWKSFFNNLKKR